MMVPVGRLVVLRNTEKRDLIRSIATITWPGLVAPVVGPPVGGFITTYATWHWIFFLNVPLGIVGMALAFLWIGNSREPGIKPFDWTGFALLGTAFTTFMYGLELVGREGEFWAAAGLFVAKEAAWREFWRCFHIRRSIAPVLKT